MNFIFKLVILDYGVIIYIAISKSSALLIFKVPVDRFHPIQHLLKKSHSKKFNLSLLFLG
jgi:hypothetical protein